MDSHTIYRIYNTITKKCYIGVTFRRKARKKEHFYYLKKGTHHSPHLQNAYNKSGHNAFRFEIIETNLSEEEAYEREAAWISFYDSYHNGYNMTEGGNVPPRYTVSCTWNGIEYMSLRECADALNLSVNGLKHRLESGYTHDDDVPQARKPRPVKWNDVEYSTLQEAADANSVTKTCMATRLSRGLSCDDEVGVIDSAIVCTWNGIEYKSIASAARSNGVSTSTMKYRIKSGWLCDADITNRIQVEWNGVAYPSIKHAARQLGITDKTLRYRLDKGYTCDDDLVKPSVAKIKQRTNKSA